MRMRNRRWFVLAAALLVSLSLGAPRMTRAQDDRDHHDDHRDDRDHHDNDRDHHDHDRFDDHDREGARDWYRDHHDYFRHNEGRYWHREWEPNIHEGFVFTQDMRRGIRPVPRELLVRLGPAPRGYRYVVIGDHVVLVDNGWRIHDVLHFELNF
jgi:hypothetical protein